MTKVDLLSVTFWPLSILIRRLKWILIVSVLHIYARKLFRLAVWCSWHQPSHYYRQVIDFFAATLNFDPQKNYPKGVFRGLFICCSPLNSASYEPFSSFIEISTGSNPKSAGLKYLRSYCCHVLRLRHGLLQRRSIFVWNKTRSGNQTWHQAIWKTNSANIAFLRHVSSQAT